MQSACDVLSERPMLRTSFTRLLSRSAIALASAYALGACGGRAGEAPDPCAHAVPPPIVVDARITRIDVLDLGEARDYVKDGTQLTAAPLAPKYGYDLDGVCSDRTKPESFACTKNPRADTAKYTDGDSGIDNSFGRNLVAYIRASWANASQVMSGFSYLETRSDGGGTLYLGTSNGLHLVIPLVAVRLTAPTADTLGTLAAVVPRDAFIASLREHFNLIAGAQFCTGSTIDTTIEAVAQSVDILLAGPPNAALPCDGISLGLRLSGTTVDAVPPIGPGCAVR